MEHHHHQQRLNPYQFPMNPPQPQGGGGGGGGDGGERLPQWSHEETREFLAIRAQLDKSFSETKRNKPLWETTSAMLRQKGFLRTPDQCKSKWKNLVTRFKGSESEVGRQFPFQDEMRRIFSDRRDRLLASEAAAAKGKGAVQVQAKESDEVEEDDEWEEVPPAASAEEKRAKKSKKKKKKKSRVEEEVEAALREFMRRQLEMEARWLEAAAARETERRAKEEEWRRMMEGLREERIAMERQWREREEERRARAEARSERRHNLVVALLDKLAQKDP